MKNELSDVIYEECFELSGKRIKPNSEKHQLVLIQPMQLRIFLQIPEYNFQRYKYCKNKTKIALLAQNSMSFPDIDAEVLYILLSIKLNMGNVMDKGHYVYDVLDYNTGTWWNCDDATITKY